MAKIGVEAKSSAPNWLFRGDSSFVDRWFQWSIHRVFIRSLSFVRSESALGASSISNLSP